ncbi:MAG: solute carrier family 23 protein [Clostridia bacterium]
MKMIYDVEAKPPFKNLIVFALQQMLAIITATLLVPMIISNNAYGITMDPAAALFGAGAGTLVYIMFTKKKSPVFLGSSFAFIAPMSGAIAFGFWGIFVGAAIAGLVYVIIATIIHFIGTDWVNKLLPPVVIGPTVALIGLSLAGNAVSDLTKASGAGQAYNLVAILCGLVTFFVTIICSAKGNKTMKLIPFIIGIVSGYVVAAIFTGIGVAANCEYLKIVNFSALEANFTNIKFTSFFNYPEFSFLIKGGNKFDLHALGNVFLLYAPVAFVVLAEHIADHKNISAIIERDLIKDPGLKRTLLGDGVGSIVGAFFGGCPNTTYGESIGCVAITKNASVASIIWAAILCMVLAFFTPFVAFVNTIPSCVLGGICVALYGFIAVSGLNMLNKIDLSESKNLFVVSSILVAGIGGLSLKFGNPNNPIITITSIATALILGIIVNLILKDKHSTSKGSVEEVVATSKETGDEMVEEPPKEN